MEIEEYIAAAQNTKEKKFWLDKLSGEPAKNYFYYDATTQNDNTRSFEKEKFTFTGELFSKFIQLSSNSDLRLHMALTAGLLILIQKYTGEKDIMIGMPIYKEGNEEKFINTALVFRGFVDPAMTFKEILVNVRQIIIDSVEHANYPVELLAEQLGMPVSREKDFPLFDIVILLENIHDKKYVEHLNYNISFTLARKENTLEGIVEYNANRYYQETIKKIISYYQEVCRQVLFNVNLKVSEVDILSETDKKKLLNEFNGIEMPYPSDKTIHQLFAEQAERSPGNIAVCSSLNLNDIFTPTSCFKKNPYIFECELGIQAFKLLKTNSHHSVVINKNMCQLLDCFTGENNLESVFAFLKDYKAAKFIMFIAQIKDILEISHEFRRQADIFSNFDYDEFISLVQLLYKNNLIEFHSFKTQTITGKRTGYEFNEVNESFDNRATLKDLLTNNEAGIEKADVLLLGDTPGMPTTGLLYLASFLRRNGVNALCRFYDDTENSQDMAAGIEKMLGQIQPRVVGISLKWFLYIARVLDMCKIIKEYSRRHGADIKVVVGGNTASYYWKEIIKYEDIDYLVRGDGEEPLLKIARGEKYIPNCVYRENGKIVENPITYIQDEKNSAEIYLSNLEEIILDKSALPFGSFFVYTQKGCAMNCLYCGGCNKAQQIAFNRKHVLRRGITETRNDILEVKKYVSTFYFEFDIVDKNIAGYCREIWKDIDLSGHFCMFNTLTPPSQELVELVSKTFRYVYWDFDVCTPSERHRKQLESLGLVKPQPSDAEIIDFLTKCEKYKNIEVRPNLITGLPYFTIDDIEPGEKLLNQIMSNFSCFSELHWARLHAQPGAPILESAEQLQMHSFASSFTDFFEYSRKNVYANVETFNYPFIYYKDEQLNSRITNFYIEINKKLPHYTREKIQVESLTYQELNEKSDKLAAALIASGVMPGDIVGLMLERSVAIPVGILGILKCGAAYLPIDPEFPPGRVDYMIKDSSAKILINKSAIDDLLKETFHYSSFTFDPSSFAYIIYTSGTTGKPKGVAITHKNLVNYVNWFSQKVGLTAQDKTILTTSYAFDLGYTSLYNSLLKGCKLHILPREIYLLAERLLNYIKQYAITFIKVTPSLFSVMVNSPAFSKVTCQTLRLAAMGGEPINVKDLEKAHLICPHLSIMNHYGPTETTIGCAAAIINFKNFEEYKKHPVIGKPIANSTIYILSKDLDILPVGVPGELCISGAGVGQGYLNRPELTAEKFLKNHRSYRSYRTNILYHTGDLARWLPDGTIEFLGRIDTQVKIRGYRIELGEIENRIAKHPSVKEAVVVVKDQKENDGKYLCAYIVPATHESNSELVAKTLKRIPGTDLIQLMDHIKAKYNEIAVKSNGKSLTFESLDQISGWAAEEITAKYDDRYRLSQKERTRYKRQMLLHGWGIEAQEKLKSTTVFVAGAGGGASPTIFQLALAGVGTIKVCDFDEVELSNLNRQFLHDEERLGMNKALSAQMTVKKINPHVKVIPYTGKLTRENIVEWVGDADIIFDMFDGPADKFILSEFAVVKKIPHIIISMTDINAYTAVCHTPHTPCYHCLFDKKKLETIVSGMKGQVENYSKNPLPVVATSLFISTGVAVNEGLKILLGFKKPAYNKFFYFNQRGEEENLVYTPGYKAMTYLFSDHFLEVCKEQGFDWDTGWRGNFLEELIIKTDPHCPLCSNEGEELRKDIEKKIKNAAVTVNIKEIAEAARKDEGESLNTVGVLLHNDIDMAAAIIGILKAGKSIVPIDPTAPAKTQLHVLEDSEVRVILTNDQYIKAAQKLIDKYNHNIKIVNISLFNKSNLKPGTIEMKPAKIAYLLYPPDPNGTPGFNNIFTDIYNALITAETYIFNPIDQGQSPGGRVVGWPNQIRDYLISELPDYMVPTHFVKLEKIPLTPNGKIDKKALPDPALKEENDYAAPRNEQEEKLAVIWAEVLGIKKEIIGIDTNFFGLGGHSLNATILISKIHKELNVRLPLAEFFKMPTIKGLTEYILSVEKEAFAAIEPAEEKEYYALSPAQRRLYILHKVVTDNIAYNMPYFISLQESMEKEKLELVFKKLIERHDSLRTCFITINEEPVQKIYNEFDFAIRGYNASEGEVDQITSNFVEPFDLSKAPLLRVGLLTVNHGRQILMIDMHHIITDRISHNILEKEFRALYFKEELTPLRLQYKDYSEWQNGKAHHQMIKEQEKYWLEIFSGEVPVLNLPFDYSRPIMQSFEGNMIQFSLAVKESRSIKNLAKETGTTAYMFILSVLTILLSRLSGQEDIVIGTPIAARRHSDLEKIIGMFVNTLAMRNAPCGEKSYREFLMELKQCTLEAYENQEYPFEELVDNITVSRDIGRNPVFDIMFNLLNIQEYNDTIPDTGTEEYRSAHIQGIAKFDLTLTAVDMGERLLFNIEYCTRLFKPETIDRFISYFKKLLDSIFQDINKKLCTLDIITLEEKNRVLYEWNDTRGDYPKDKTINQIFEEQVKLTPDHIAVIGPWEREKENSGIDNLGSTAIHLTYLHLNEQSNRLAHMLQTKGMGTDTIVAIMVERSIEMIVGILGILAAGGAYLPIDPEYPQERIDYILRDSNAAILLKNTNKKEINCQLSIVNSQLSMCELRGSLHHPSIVHHYNHLAYIIYTSGSTGRPKGVMVQCRNVVRLVKNTNYIPFMAGKRLLQSGILAFDASTFEIWGALLNGLTLCLVKKEIILTADRLKEKIKKYDIEIMWMTSPLFNQLSQIDIDIFSNLKHLVVGGDVLSVIHMNRLKREFPDLKITNGYGPTENTTFSTTYLIEKEYDINIPIGKPIANSTAYIVDRNNFLQPIGVAGELLVGGDGVALGYLNNPELTAKKFKKHRSYGSYRTNILYKTGDLARWLPDGNIEFIGRIDQQVKVRGFRIELGEIETCLAKITGIKESVVIVREDEPGDKYLCAYIVSTKAYEIIELREYLTKELPAHMVPAYFVPVEKIPLTSNGKIDSKSLPGPGLKGSEEYAAPRDAIEKKLTELWTDILVIRESAAARQSPLVEQIGIDDNFFQLGGHSLKATILVSKIDKEFNVKVPLVKVFKSPTIRELSTYIKEKRNEGYKSIEPAEKKEFYLLASPQRVLYVQQQKDLESTAYNMPQFFKIENAVNTDKTRLRDACKSMIQRHDSLRTSFEIKDGQPVQIIHDTVEFDLEYYEGDMSETLVLENFVRPFDLTRAPLLRVGLLKRNDQDYLIMVDMHHIISDAISLEILHKDFMVLLSGKTLPPLMLQYKDYSEWQNSSRQLAAVKQQGLYWLNLFARDLPDINFPSDFPRSRIQSFEGRSLEFQLESKEYKALKELALKNEMTLFMLLLSLFKIFLAKVSKIEDVVVGIPIAQRGHAYLEQIIGMFASTIALRTYPGKEKTFKEFFSEVKESMLAAFENQDYSVDHLMNDNPLGLNKNKERISLFDVLFDLHELGNVSHIGEPQTFSRQIFESEHKQAKVGLMLICYNTNDALSFEFIYCIDLYKQSTIERFTGYLKNIIDAVLENEDYKLKNIQIVHDLVSSQSILREEDISDFGF